MKESDIEELKNIAKRNFEPIKGSSIFLTLFNKKMLEDPVPLLQLGMAIMMGKPIAVLVKKGDKIPDTLRDMSFCVEEYTDTTNLQSATKKIVGIAKEKGYM